MTMKRKLLFVQHVANIGMFLVLMLLLLWLSTPSLKADLWLLKTLFKVLKCTKKSDLHSTYVFHVKAIQKDVNVSSLLSSQYESQRQGNMICLTAILQSIVFLARQGLSIRGSNHLESKNRLWLLQLRSLDLSILKVWL